MFRVLGSPDSAAASRVSTLAPALIAVLLLGVTGFLVVDFSFEEPYTIFRARDAYVQLVLGTVLLVLWVELTAVLVARIIARVRILDGFIILLAIGGIWAIHLCQSQYVSELSGPAL